MVDHSREACSLHENPRRAGYRSQLIRSMYYIAAVLLLSGCGITDLVGPTHETDDESRPVSITTEHLPSAVQGVAYEKHLTAEGGDGSYSWSLVDGALPDGLDLSADGVIHGSPAQAGAVTFTLRVESGDDQKADRSYTLSVDGHSVSIVTEELPDAVIGERYAEAVVAEGGDGTWTWYLVEGRLPPGLSLTDGGVIEGTPTDDGDFVFVVKARAGTGDFARRELALTVTGNPVVVTTESLPSGTVRVSYRAVLGAEGASGEYRWSIVEGALPAGLALSADGVIDGVPEEVGTSAFTVRVESGDGQIVERPFSIEVQEVGLTIYTEANLPGAVEGLPYQLFLDWDGGEAPWTWSIVSGALPNDLFLASWGAIQGIAEDPGTHVFTLRVESGDGQSAERTFTLVVEPSR